MYYRIAVQPYAPPALRWQSDPLCSLPTVVQWLMHFRVFPPERLRVFSSDCRDSLDEQLRRNAGLESTSVPATHFVPARASVPSAVAPTTAAPRPPAANENTPSPALPPSYRQPLMSTPLDQRRDALERGPGGDCDTPYQFTMPSSTPEVIAWARLMARVRQGDLRAEVAVLAEANAGC